MAHSYGPTTKWLFIGDSITDCGQREDKLRIGNGYVSLIRDYLLAKDPANAPDIINRGISGNKVTDLAARWQQDVIEHRPELLSIKIGVNDVWHGLGGPGGVPIDQFTTTYHEIISLTKILLPESRIVLCEPSVIWPPQPVEGNERLQPYVQAVHDLAEKLDLGCVVPLHTAFEEAKKARPQVDWAPDGVHPSPSGHMLIARTWLASLRLL